MGIAERIKERREALEKSAAELAERLEVAERLAGTFAAHASGDVVVRDLMTGEESTANNLRSQLARARYEIAALHEIDPGASRVVVAVDVRERRPGEGLALLGVGDGGVDYATLLGECERRCEALEEQRDSLIARNYELATRNRELSEHLEKLDGMKDDQEGGAA